MGMEIDWANNLIKITSPTTSVDAQTLHDFIEDQMATPRGLTEGDILLPEGKIADPGNPGVYSQIILQLNSPWQIQFWQGSGYATVYGGKIVGGLNNQPIKATGAAGDITVLISPVDGLATVIETGTSGLTEAESQALLDIAADIGTINTNIGTISTSIGTIEASLTSIEGDISTMQGDIGAIELSISGINSSIITITTDIGTIQTDISNLAATSQFMADIEGGRWQIDVDAKQMVFYKSDNMTEVARFNLYDELGSPTADPSRIAERSRA